MYATKETRWGVLFKVGRRQKDCTFLAEAFASSSGAAGHGGASGPGSRATEYDIRTDLGRRRDGWYRAVAAWIVVLLYTIPKFFQDLVQPHPVGFRAVHSNNALVARSPTQEITVLTATALDLTLDLRHIVRGDLLVNFIERAFDF